MEDAKILAGSFRGSKQKLNSNKISYLPEVVKLLFKEIKDDCDAQLAVAMPALEKAIKALDTLKESDIGEMKGYTVPPADLVLVLDAVALLLGHKPGWD